MRKPLVVFAVVAIVALSAGAAAPAGMKGAGAPKPLRMTVGALGSIGALDVRQGKSLIAREVWNLQYPTLTALDPETLEPSPGVASGWSPTATGHGWIYTLPGGLHWSDGKPLTAADVVYSFVDCKQRQWPFEAKLLDHLRIRARNSHSVEITSDRRVGPGLLLHIVPEHIYSKSRRDPAALNDITALGVGDGPWHVVARTSDTVELDVLGRPAGPPLDQIVFRTYPSADALVTALAHGQVDVVSGVPAVDVARLENLKQVTVNHAGDGTEYVLRFATRLGRRIRTVASLAVDGQALVADVAYGVGTAIAPEAQPQRARLAVGALKLNAAAAPTIAFPAESTERGVVTTIRASFASIGLPLRAVAASAHPDLVVERVPVADKPAGTIGLFAPDVLQAFRTDNVTGFLREPSRRNLIVFGPTVSQYSSIVAAAQPPGEKLSNIALGVGAAVLLAVFAGGYWIALRIRNRAAP